MNSIGKSKKRREGADVPRDMSEMKVVGKVALLLPRTPHCQGSHRLKHATRPHRADCPNHFRTNPGICASGTPVLILSLTCTNTNRHLPAWILPKWAIWELILHFSKGMWCLESYLLFISLIYHLFDNWETTLNFLLKTTSIVCNFVWLYATA
jgi:hypothetical protein